MGHRLFRTKKSCGKDTQQFKKTHGAGTFEMKIVGTNFLEQSRGLRHFLIKNLWGGYCLKWKYDYGALTFSEQKNKGAKTFCSRKNFSDRPDFQ